ncbi:hypothetical protein Tco_0640949, partial [Tanacetum coccineum]
SRFIGTLDEDLNSLSSKNRSSRPSTRVFSPPLRLPPPVELWGPEFP